MNIWLLIGIFIAVAGTIATLVLLLSMALYSFMEDKEDDTAKEVLAHGCEKPRDPDWDWPRR
jgi:hypothetical protein